jgi:hypothetical protein
MVGLAKTDEPGLDRQVSFNPDDSLTLIVGLVRSDGSIQGHYPSWLVVQTPTFHKYFYRGGETDINHRRPQGRSTPFLGMPLNLSRETNGGAFPSRRGPSLQDA